MKMHSRRTFFKTIVKYYDTSYVVETCWQKNIVQVVYKGSSPWLLVQNYYSELIAFLHILKTVICMAINSPKIGLKVSLLLMYTCALWKTETCQFDLCGSLLAVLLRTKRGFKSC